MIKTIPSASRHFTDMGWLKTFWLFSFSNYYDPANVSHGSLRVFNDDVVEPHQGFDTHPHEEMEIISVILEGEMVHRDTMGNETVIRKNDVQRMTAGTGLFHSEKNASDRPVHFYQIWIKPDKKGLAPSYDQKTYSPDLWINTLALIASDESDGRVVKLNTDASLYRARLDKGRDLAHHPGKNRKPFVYVVNGRMQINGKTLGTNDQARIENETNLYFTAVEDAEIILIDVPA